MKLHFHLSALLLTAPAAVGATTFPSDSKYVAMGGVTDVMTIKFESGNDSDLQPAVQRVLSDTGCSSAKRAIRHAGKHEHKLVAAGLNRWYEFDCGSAAPTDHAEGEGAQAAIARLQVSTASQSANSDGEVTTSTQADELGIEIVSYQHKIAPIGTQANIRGAFNTTRRLNYPNDPLLGFQTHHYDLVDLEAALGIIEDNGVWPNAKNVVCQVLDSGWDVTHVDLGDNEWNNPGEICGTGQDNDGNGFIDDCHGFNHPDNTGNDLLGSGDHGTHVAGTIGATTDNGIGVAGVAGGTSTDKGIAIMTNVGFGASGSGGFAEALTYGANNGANISSNSWGYINEGAFDQLVLDAIDYAVDQGVIVVFAAGNDGRDGEWYPGFYESAIAVAAVDDQKVAAGFTNFGDWVDISAPGVAVYSTELANTYGSKQGTSMACPHVSAILGLGKTLYPEAENDDLIECLYRTAENIDSLQDPSRFGKLGAGLVKADAFLRCVENVRDGVPFPTFGPTPMPAPTPAGPTTLMPVCEYSRTFSSSTLSRGLYFQAPREFCIVGLSVPNEEGESLQNLEVFVRSTIPALWPSASTGSSVFYAPGESANALISTNIQVQAGQYVGILGTAGSSTMRNSYCAESTFLTDIGGQSVTIGRLLTQQNIASNPTVDYSRESANIARVNMYYETGTCDGGLSPPPLASPSPGPVAPTPAPVETLMPICPYSRTFSSSTASRGFYFTANSTFCLTGLSVPNEQNENIQNVQVFIRDTIPKLYPGVSSGGSVFYAPNMPVGTVIDTEIQVIDGDVVGILGTAGTGTMRNSYCAETSFDTTIAGKPVTIERFLTQQSIFTSPANDYSREIGNIGRINMYYVAGRCGSNPSPVTPSPVLTPMPSSSPSEMPSAGNCMDDGFCGNCNEEGDRKGCNCPECRDAVCENDSYCCDVRWDDTCAKDAEMRCGCGDAVPSMSPSDSPVPESCLGEGACGNCNKEGAGTGCECPECRDKVCDIDSYCCDVRWDETCAGLAEDICECPLCPEGTCGNCDEFRGGPGCSCPDCQTAVCAEDAHCCDFFWDRLCAMKATEVCTCSVETSPYPSAMPSESPYPSAMPSEAPSSSPYPSPHPSAYPSGMPSFFPTPQPTPRPTPQPTPRVTPQPTPRATPQPTPQPQACVMDCPNALGSGCGFCYLAQRGGGCNSCSVCQGTVCAILDFCCTATWNSTCGDLAKERCGCCNIPPS